MWLFNRTVINRPALLLVTSILPFSPLATKYRRPFASYLQVDCGFVGQVVQIHSLACFGNCHFNLSALVPLIKRCYRYKIGPGLQRSAQRGFVVFTVDAVSSVLEVPGSNARVNIPWAHTWDEYEVIIFTERFNRVPVALSGAVGKSISSKVSVETIKTGSQDIPLMFLLNQQGNEDGIIRGVPDAVTLCVFQQFGPLLRVHQIWVIHIEERKELASVCAVLKESRVLSISERRK